jgi:hypothetical protein
MKQTRAQKKAKLQAKVEVLVEAMLDWEEANAAPSFRQIEEEVLKLRQRFGEVLVSAAVEGQEASQPAEAPPCSSCGKQMEYKGQKGRAVGSWLGGLNVERGHYYCRRCKSGLFPPRPATGVGG